MNEILKQNKQNLIKNLNYRICPSAHDFFNYINIQEISTNVDRGMITNILDEYIKYENINKYKLNINLIV